MATMIIVQVFQSQYYIHSVVYKAPGKVFFSAKKNTEPSCSKLISILVSTISNSQVFLLEKCE